VVEHDLAVAIEVFREPDAVAVPGTCAAAGLDAAMIDLDDRRGGDRFAGRIVEMQHIVVMKRSLIFLRSQGLVATLIDDLLTELSLKVIRGGASMRPLSEETRRRRPRPLRKANTTAGFRVIYKLSVSSAA
jgi:hypothetical protein